MSETVFRLGGYAPPDATHTAALRMLADRIEAGTGGRIRTEVFGNILDTGRPASDLLSMVEAGELAMCYFSTSYLGSRVPALQVLETPFLFRDLDHAHAALDGDLGAALTEAIGSATGLVALGFWDNGFRHLTNRLRPVVRPEDCAGMRVRLQPNAVHEALVESWGAIPVAVDLGAAVGMIASGEVDAQENPLANTIAYGVTEVHRFATMTGHLYGARGVYANPETLESLDPADREVVASAVRAAVAFQRDLAERRESELRASMEAGGMEFVDLSPDQRDAFRRAAEDVVARVRAEVGDALFSLVPAP